MLPLFGREFGDESKDGDVSDHVESSLTCRVAMLVLGRKSDGRVERTVPRVSTTSLDDLEEHGPDRMVYRSAGTPRTRPGRT